MAMRKTRYPVRPGLVLIEMLVAVTLLALLTAVAMFSYSSVVGRSYFQRRAQKLVGAIQTAWTTAQESDLQFEVELSFTEGYWVVRKAGVLDESVTEEEMIIKSGMFDERFSLDYVLFDDGDDTRNPREGERVTTASFKAGHSGWQFGGKIVLRDEDGNMWSIVIYRIGKPVELVAGDATVLIPVESKYIPF